LAECEAVNFEVPGSSPGGAAINKENNMDRERLEQKKAAAESRWEAAQLQAANAQRELDYAVAVVDKHADDMSPEELAAAKAQIAVQQNSIKDFTMKSFEVYKSALLTYENGLERLNA
jgi:hypothetical protein